MKYSSFRIAGPAFLPSLVFAVSLALSGCATSRQKATHTNTKTGHVQIRAITGEALVATGADGSFNPGRLKQKIAVGQSIRTGVGSTADLYIPDVGTMRLTPSSFVRIKSIEVDKSKKPPFVQAEFDLPEGRIQGNTLKMSADSEVKVNTPKGTILIK